MMSSMHEMPAEADACGSWLVSEGFQVAADRRGPMGQRAITYYLEPLTIVFIKDRGPLVWVSVGFDGLYGRFFLEICAACLDDRKMDDAAWSIEASCDFLMTRLADLQRVATDRPFRSCLVATQEARSSAMTSHYGIDL
jgi:hypothetical protein